MGRTKMIDFGWIEEAWRILMDLFDYIVLGVEG